MSLEPQSRTRRSTEPTLLLVGSFVDRRTGTRAVGSELAQRLQADGWSVTLTSSRQRRLTRLLDVLATIVSTRRSIEVAQIDVYSGRAFVLAEVAAWTLRRFSKPIVLTLHGGDLPRFAERHQDRVARLLRAADAVTAPSSYLQRSFENVRDDIRVIPNAVEVSAYDTSVRSPPAPELIWLRAFDQLYRPTLAIEALELLRQRWPHARLSMIGPDKGDGSRALVEQRCRELDLQDHVELRGPIRKSEVPSALARADLFLNTSSVDNTPVSVIEAMACGLCVISTDVGGLPDLIADGDTGLLTDAESATALARAAARVLSEPELAARLSSNARKFAETLDWSHVLPLWHDLFRSLVGANAGS